MSSVRYHHALVTSITETVYIYIYSSSREAYEKEVRMKVLLGLFVIAHGLLHASYLTPKPDDPNYPFHLDKGWFANIAGASAKPVGTILVLATVIAFAIAGLGLLGVPMAYGLWKTVLIIGTIASLLLLLLYWHVWLIFGIIVNIALLYGVSRLGLQP